MITSCFLGNIYKKKAAIANRNLGIIFKSFTYLDKEISLCLYKSLVRPHLEYAKHKIADCLDYAYSLVKGGISLHLKDKESVGNLIESWSGEVFGGNTRPYLPKTVTSIVTAFLSDVPVNIFI